ncbi:MAG: hypothetical protein WDO70_07790 [Alphaproteobacteria bacterium]
MCAPKFHGGFAPYNAAEDVVTGIQQRRAEERAKDDLANAVAQCETLKGKSGVHLASEGAGTQYTIVSHTALLRKITVLDGVANESAHISLSREPVHCLTWKDTFIGVKHPNYDGFVIQGQAADGSQIPLYLSVGEGYARKVEPPPADAVTSPVPGPASGQGLPSLAPAPMSADASPAPQGLPPVPSAPSAPSAPKGSASVQNYRNML